MGSSIKIRFIINYILILVSSFAAICATQAGLWFSAIGAVLLSAFLTYKVIRIFGDCTEALENEKHLLRLTQERSVETEREINFYKTMMESVDTAIIMTTENGCIEWMNGAARGVIGQAEILPVNILESVRNRKSDVTVAGKEYSLGCSRVAMRNSNRNIVVMKDIHSSIERNRVESWHKLVRVMTHEIMNSMTPIISLSETLCIDANSETLTSDTEAINNIRQGMEIIKRRSIGLLSFVENYRKLTRIAPPDRRSFAIKGLLDDLCKLFPYDYIRFDSQAVDTTQIFADRAQIEQVFINLLKNSVEACEERKNYEERYEKEIIFTAKIKNEGTDKFAEFCITDNGTGILATVREQLFVPFFTTKKNGSGIGLNLCKQIINNHGGSIEIESDENGGCTVRCSLPLR